MSARAARTRLESAVDPAHDHVLGDDNAAITLVEYGSYACTYCRAAHQVVADLRDRFGDRLRYVFRQRPIGGSEDALRAAEFAEYAAAATGNFWPVHDALMTRGSEVDAEVILAVADEFDVPGYDERPDLRDAAIRRVRADRESADRSGVIGTPTFFINGRRYEGAWDEASLAEAMLGSLGHRLHAATLDFVRWAPSTGLLLLLATVAALVIANGSAGPAFAAFWQRPFGFVLGDRGFSMSLLHWINDGLLAVFFLVVGLEIKRELTVGRLASWRAAALPIAASLGGVLVPALLYLTLIPAGPLAHGWGVTIATDTAFAIALIVMLGDRVPIELRVFLTAAVIVDDLVAIVVVALFYSGTLHFDYLAGAAALALLLVVLNRSGVYRALPYALLGVLLWLCLHHGGLHATLAGVILALVVPTRPPPNLHALTAQAEMVMRTELANAEEGRGVMHHGLSEPALRDRCDPRSRRISRGQAAAHDRAVVELSRAAGVRVRECRRHMGAGDARRTRFAGAGDRPGPRARQAHRHRRRSVDRGPNGNCGQTGWLHLATTRRRRRARRHRFHDVPVHRGTGIRSDLVRRREDRDLRGLAACRRARRGDPLEARASTDGAVRARSLDGMHGHRAPAACTLITRRSPTGSASSARHRRPLRAQFRLSGSMARSAIRACRHACRSSTIANAEIRTKCIRATFGSLVNVTIMNN